MKTPGCFIRLLLCTPFWYSYLGPTTDYGIRANVIPKDDMIALYTIVVLVSVMGLIGGYLLMKLADSTVKVIYAKPQT